MCPFCQSNICDGDLHLRKWIAWWRLHHIPNIPAPTSFIHVQWHKKEHDNQKIKEED